MTVPVLSIARAQVAVLAADRDAIRLEAAKYARRRLVRRIDEAIDACERANLASAGGDAPPERAAAMVAELQLEAGEPASRPRTAQEALDELFRLQEPGCAGPRWRRSPDGAAAASAMRRTVRSSS